MFSQGNFSREKKKKRVGILVMRSEGLLERELHFCLCIKKYSAGGQLGENGRIIGGGGVAYLHFV